MFCIEQVQSKFISPEYILKNIKLVTPSTPEPDEYAKPMNFAKTNNLRRKSGSPFFAKGEFLIIEGFVFDLLGVPIDSAIVKIWQTNNFGYYNYLVEDKEDFSQYDVDFESTGITRTDNYGQYFFYTIIPGYFGNRTPHVHFLIEHPDFVTLETEMFFPNHPRNKIDNKYRILSKKNRYLLTCKMYFIDEKNPSYGKKCVFDIKLNGINKYKRY